MAGIYGFGIAIPRRRLSSNLWEGAWRPAPERAGPSGAPSPAPGGREPAPKRPQQERAVAGFDEDAVTLGVEAGLGAIESLVPYGFDASKIDCLLFASTTSPFLERSPAALLKEVLDLPDHVRTVNLSGSISSGVDALLIASEFVDRGIHKNVLVVAADKRTPPPGDALEMSFGDGGCAFLVGRSGGDKEGVNLHTSKHEGLEAYSQAKKKASSRARDRASVLPFPPIATIGPVARVSASTPDVWRTAGEDMVRWDDIRLARVHYALLARRAIGALVEKGANIKDLDGVVPYAPDPKSGIKLVRSLGFDVKRHYKDFVSIHTGLTGSPHVVLMIAAALERAHPGERYLVIGYGDGACAFLIEAGEGIAASQEHRESGEEEGEAKRLKPAREPAGKERLAGMQGRGGTRQGAGAQTSRFKQALSARLPIPSYTKYLESRGLLKKLGEEGEVFSSEAMLEREKGRFLRLEANGCRSCGTLYYINVKRCPSCGGDAFCEKKLSRRGKVFTFTREHYYPTPEPPLTMAVVDLEGGGRMTLQVADDDGTIEIGTPVELVLRKMHQALGQPNYFWKCRRTV